MGNSTVLVATTVLVTVGSAEAKLVLAKKPPTIRPVLGGFGLGIFLILIAMASEYLASTLCVLLIITALLINGPALFNFAAKL